MSRTRQARPLAQSNARERTRPDPAFWDRVIDVMTRSSGFVGSDGSSNMRSTAARVAVGARAGTAGGAVKAAATATSEAVMEAKARIGRRDGKVRSGVEWCAPSLGLLLD